METTSALNSEAPQTGGYANPCTPYQTSNTTSNAPLFNDVSDGTIDPTVLDSTLDFTGLKGLLDGDVDCGGPSLFGADNWLGDNSPMRLNQEVPAPELGTSIVPSSTPHAMDNEAEGASNSELSYSERTGKGLQHPYLDMMDPELSPQEERVSSLMHNNCEERRAYQCLWCRSSY